MAKLDLYDIPIDIQNLDFTGDISIIRSIEKLKETSRSNEDAYHWLQSTFVFLEEAANSIRAHEYNMKNVQIKTHSRLQSIFKFERDVMYRL